jgi:hypothetical protein
MVADEGTQGAWLDVDEAVAGRLTRPRAINFAGQGKRFAAGDCRRLRPSMEHLIFE